MIAFVCGKIDDVSFDNVVLDVNGIGYNIHISSSTAGRLPGRGEQVKLYTYTSVREDAIWLYGFLTRADLEIFKKCITVNGIGPKGALSILSIMDADTLRYAILSEDKKAIAKAPGIGMKTAERLILDLKEKVKIDDEMISREMAAQAGAFDGTNSGLNPAQMKSAEFQDALQALVALGYGQTESMKALQAIPDLENMESGKILKAALKHLIG